MPRKNEPSERTCIVTRTPHLPDELIRFVLDPDGNVVPDLKRRLPGRGVWVTASQRLVAEAEKRKLFARAFGTSVQVEPGLAERVADLLTAAALGALGMARKAGTVVLGFGKAEAALASGKAIGVLHASDAAEDGIRKLDAAGRRGGGVAKVVRAFDSGQLGLALGGANVIHAALLAGRTSEDVLARIAARARYLDDSGLPGDAVQSVGDADGSAGQKTYE